MSKGLRNIKDDLEKQNTIYRRAQNKTDGLGHIAALEAQAKIKSKAKHEEPADA